MEEYIKDNRIKEALELRGMKQIELAEKTGLKKASINNWIKQRWQPKQKAVVLMAKALNVSEMWLAGYDAPMERTTEQIRMDELAQLVNLLRKNERLKKICVNLSQLTPAQIDTVESMVNELSKLNFR